MDALAQLQRAQYANKSLTMAERERLKQFNVFSKALTSSMPSRMARGEETASALHPDTFLYKAATLQRQRKRKKLKLQSLSYPTIFKQF